MTNRMPKHFLKQILNGIFSKKIALVTLLSSSVLTQGIHAQQQEWWFDVEVILFKRNLDVADISEKFKQSRLSQANNNNNYLDLLTPYLHPDLRYLRAGLPYCRASNRLAKKTQHEQDFAFGLPKNKTASSSSSSSSSKQNKHSLGVSSNEMPKETFQYQVATTDIFANSNNKDAVTQTDLELAATADLKRPPIHVEFIEWQIPTDVLCAYAEQIDATFASISALQNESHNPQSIQTKQLPKVIDGTVWQQSHGAFLLPSSNMNMNDLYEKIQRQSDIAPVLHLNWRQEVKFGRDNSQTFRLFAGENFADKFDANGEALVKDTDSLFARLQQPTDELYTHQQELEGINDNDSEMTKDDFFARINTALEDDTPFNIEQISHQTEPQTDQTDLAILKELWQLDGEITVYLRNVGRIPYLHIDSDLDFRQPIFDPNKSHQIADQPRTAREQGSIVATQPQQPSYLTPNFLQSVNFNQLRRVISKQVHYFDHPLFGMIVTINRYHWPKEQNDEAESVTQQD